MLCQVVYIHYRHKTKKTWRRYAMTSYQTASDGVWIVTKSWCTYGAS